MMPEPCMILVPDAKDPEFDYECGRPAVAEVLRSAIISDQVPGYTGEEDLVPVCRVHIHLVADDVVELIGDAD